jgi:hypothetical protein
VSDVKLWDNVHTLVVLLLEVELSNLITHIRVGNNWTANAISLELGDSFCHVVLLGTAVDHMAHVHGWEGNQGETDWDRDVLGKGWTPLRKCNDGSTEWKHRGGSVHEALVGGGFRDGHFVVVLVGERHDFVVMEFGFAEVVVC